MQQKKLPDPDAYFKHFSAYLRSGDNDHLKAVFPDARELAAAKVYRNGFLRSCVEALRASYPVVDLLVGEDYFGMLAMGYIKIHPPVSSSFVGYGERFPAYLKNSLDKHQLPYLPEFARLDRSWMTAYFAEDAILLDEEQVECWQRDGNDISAIRCELPKSAELLTLDFDVSTLWLKLKSDSEPAENTQVNKLTERLLIWRDSQDQINVRVVNVAEFSFLASLLGGNTLIAAATAAIQLQADFPVIDYFSELLNTDVLALTSNLT